MSREFNGRRKKSGTLIGVFGPGECCHIAVSGDRIYEYSTWVQGYVQCRSHHAALTYAKMIADMRSITLITFDLFSSFYPEYNTWDRIPAMIK